MNLAPPSTDQSVGLISQLFGDKWWLAISGGAEGGTFLFSLVSTINSMALAGAGLVVAYVVVNAAIGTAHEGEALGRRYHSFWVPFRSAVSFGLVAPLPTAKGLCLLQAIVLLFTWYGIGFADNLYNSSLSFLSSHGGSFYTEIQDSADVKQNKMASIAEMYKLAVNTEYLKDRMGYKIDTASGEGNLALGWAGPFRDNTASNEAFGWFIGGINTIFGANIPKPYVNTTYYADILASPPGGGNYLAVGSIKVTCATPAGHERLDSNVGTCLIQTRALDSIWTSLLSYAARAVGQLPNQSGNLAPPPANALRIVGHNYNEFLEAGAQVWASKPEVSGAYEFKKQYNEFVENASAQGWASAGVYFWQIVRVNDYVNGLLRMQPKVEASPDAMEFLTLNGLSDYKILTNNTAKLITVNFLGDAVIDPSAYQELYSSTERATSVTGYVGWAAEKAGEAIKDAVIGAISHTMLAIMGKTIGAISSSQDSALTQMKSAGDYMLDIAGVLYTGNVATSTLAAIPVVGKLAKPAQALSDATMPLATMLFVIGMDLGYVIPMIPFFFMAIAVVIWLIYFIEAWIAAPLWAVAHAIPEGEGMAGQRAAAGYFMFFNILIKPALIVLGFFIALILSNTIIRFVSAPFMTFVWIMQGRTLTGLFALSGILLIYAGFMTFLVYKCFGMITFIPDKVPAWLGQMFRELGPEAGAPAAMKGMSNYNPGQNLGSMATATTRGIGRAAEAQGKVVEDVAKMAAGAATGGVGGAAAGAGGAAAGGGGGAAGGGGVAGAGEFAGLSGGGGGQGGAGGAESIIKSNTAVAQQAGGEGFTSGDIGMKNEETGETEPSGRAGANSIYGALPTEKTPGTWDGTTGKPAEPNESSPGGGGSGIAEEDGGGDQLDGPPGGQRSGSMLSDKGWTPTKAYLAAADAAQSGGEDLSDSFGTGNPLLHDLDEGESNPQPPPSTNG